MKTSFNRKGPNWPKEARALKHLEAQIELENLGDLVLPLPVSPRYLVTYMLSVTSGRIRSGTVISITNQSKFTNRVIVTFFKGFTDNRFPVGTCAFSIPPEFTVDFASRNLPSDLCAVNCVPSPELTFDEGRAIVSSLYPEIAVSSRVYYTGGNADNELFAITDSKVVQIGEGNIGD